MFLLSVIFSDMTSRHTLGTELASSQITVGDNWHLGTTLPHIVLLSTKRLAGSELSFLLVLAEALPLQCCCFLNK